VNTEFAYKLLTFPQDYMQCHTSHESLNSKECIACHLLASSQNIQ